MMRRIEMLALILYLIACVTWLRLSSAAQPLPSLLVGGDWLPLPLQAAERQRVVRDLLRAEYRMPQNLSGERLSHGDAIAKDGWVLDWEALQIIVEQALPGARIYPLYRAVPAELRQEDLQSMTRILGSWQSGSGGATGRAKNVRLASEAIDGCLIWPGEVFSFNEATGPTTLERGYENAVVIVGGEFVQGPGGGVCQVASTLHCAVLEADLPVIERHRHTLPVGYVPTGQDATVSYGTLDLRFVNDTGWPLLLHATSDGYTVWIEILTMEY